MNTLFGLTNEDTGGSSYRLLSVTLVFSCYANSQCSFFRKASYWFRFQAEEQFECPRIHLHHVTKLQVHLASWVSRVQNRLQNFWWNWIFRFCQRNICWCWTFKELNWANAQLTVSLDEGVFWDTLRAIIHSRINSGVGITYIAPEVEITK